MYETFASESEKVIEKFVELLLSVRNSLILLSLILAYHACA